MRIHLIFLSALFLSCGFHHAKKGLEFPPPEKLYQQAVEETLTPVHPGRPGQAPFWNEYSQRFIYVPSFDFKEITGATEYRYTAIADSSGERYSFTAEKPWKPIVDIWDILPVGKIILTVEGLRGNKIEGKSGNREFYKASPYHGPYHPIAVGYHESIDRFLHYLYNSPYIQYWLQENKPDPGYGLYCYPSKMIASVIRGMILFTDFTNNSSEKEKAMQIARISADYLMHISQPHGNPLEYFPPTYTGPIYADMQDEYRGESLADRIMLIYPAVAAKAYLDLYDKIQDRIYLDAAVRIAETYRKLQLKNGSWHLLIYAANGDPVGHNYVVPTGVIGFFNRLMDEYNIDGFSSARDRALQFIQDNVVKQYNWEGQFEDQKPSEKYKNLSKGQACAYALYLFRNYPDDEDKIRQALDLIRFAEDQFVIWDNSNHIDSWGIKSDQWVTPCVLEQYNFYTPVNASSADMIEAFREAYVHTGNILYLAKAIALANTIIVTQNKETGHYPTYLVRDLLDQEGWINCMVYTAQTINELDKFIKSVNP